MLNFAEIVSLLYILNLVNEIFVWVHRVNHQDLHELVTDMVNLVELTFLLK
jgi:hypothetical protein